MPHPIFRICDAGSTSAYTSVTIKFPPHFKRRTISCLSVVCMQAQSPTSTFGICVAIVNCYLDHGGCSYVLLGIWLPGCDFCVHVRNRPKTVCGRKVKLIHAISRNIGCRTAVELLAPKTAHYNSWGTVRSNS